MMGIGAGGLWMSGNGGGGRDFCQRDPPAHTCCIAHSIPKLLQAISGNGKLAVDVFSGWLSPLAKGDAETRTPNGIMVECCVAPSCGKLRTTFACLPWRYFVISIIWLRENNSSSWESADAFWDVRRFAQFPAYRTSADRMVVEQQALRYATQNWTLWNAIIT